MTDSADVEKITEAIQAVVECAHQADADLCGEQRKFHLPRLRRAQTLLMELFPLPTATALEKSVDGWGDPLITKD